MSRRILVADDSSTIQKVIKIAFARYSVEMLEATSLVEALSVVARTPPSALILDASLPGAQGPQDLARLSVNAGGAPILLLVGTYESIDEAQFRASGFNSFLRKPFDSADLVNKVNEMLGGGLGQAVARSEAIPPGSTQRPAHATVIHPGGLAELERQARGANVPPPPVPASTQGRSPTAPPDLVPPPPPVARQGSVPRRTADGSNSFSVPAATSKRSVTDDITPEFGLDEARQTPISHSPQMFRFDPGDVTDHHDPRATRRGERRENQVFEPSSRPSRRLSDHVPSGVDDSDFEPAVTEPRGQVGRDLASDFDLEDSGNRMMPPSQPAPQRGTGRAGANEPQMPGLDADLLTERRDILSPRDYSGLGSLDADHDGPRLDGTDLGEAPGAPPPFATDERRRGRRAFAGAENLRDPEVGSGVTSTPSLREPGRRERAEAASFTAQMRAELLSQLGTELPALVRDAVEAYCERHFKSLAREVIAAELRRLADEKARHLVDP